MSKVFGARVKNVLSGDTVVLSPLNGGHQERVLSLAHLQAPRIQSNEKYGFESREILRKLLVGKEIRFWVIYKTKSGHEFGDISSPVFNSLAEYVLAKGGAKLREDLHSEDDDDLAKWADLQTKAQTAKVGLWATHLTPIEVVARPSESDVANSRTDGIPSIVEKVISGDRVIVRLQLSKTKQSVLPVLIAGVRAPRTAVGEEPAEPGSTAAKNYVEDRLLARDVAISVLGESSSGVLVGKISHPAGNISEKLLQEGLVEVADWQSSIVGAQGMSVLRKAEKSAKTAGKGLWKSVEKSKAVKSDGGFVPGSSFSATVTRIISADTLEITTADSVLTVQLAAVRGPRQSDATTAPFSSSAKEFVRQKTIGKHVEVTVESIRPASEQYGERAMVTIEVHDRNLAELLVSSGYATVLHYRKGEEVPSYWDSLIESESAAKKAHKGIYGKPPAVGRVVDASENAAKAKPFLFTFESRGKVSGVVEHVLSSSRYIISVPKESLRLILVLGGLTNRSKDDEFSKEALAFANQKAYQRDVQIEIYGADRVGGFIGNLYLPGSNVPFQISLLDHGLAQCHDRSLNQTKFGTQFEEAEASAKEEKRGLWATYDPSKDVTNVTASMESLKIEKKYHDIEVTEVLSDGTIAVQFINADSKKLKEFMLKFHASATTFPPIDKPPKKGDLVASKYSQNGKHYRTRVLSYDRATSKCQVQQIDYGTVESVPLSDIKALPSQYSVTAYKPQAHIAQLSLIKLPPESQPEYLEEAIYYLEDRILDKQLIACETFKNPAPGIELDVELYDPDAATKDPSVSINKELVEKGYVLVKKDGLSPYERLLVKEQNELIELEKVAKRAHKGIWEYGDIEGEDNV